MALLKEFRNFFSWNYEEMPRIDPFIVVHDIKTYLSAKPVRKKLRLVHPRKIVAIKVEVENLLKDGFIYPLPLTEWGSNIILIMKKKGTITMCVNYKDLNKACPKGNYILHFIDQIIDNCSASFIFYFMDGFPSYN